MIAVAALRAHPRRTVVAATALTAAAGVALGLAIAPGPAAPAPAAAPPAPRVGLESGIARLPLPADWRPLGRRSTLPGFDRATAVRAGGAEAALDLRVPDHASLLPASVVSAAGGRLPAPTLRGPEGRTTWRYDLPGALPGTRIAAFVLPTTGQIVTIACAAPEAELGRVAASCERAIATVRLVDAAALPPTQETAAAIVLPDVMARLNAVRRGARRRLAAARTPKPRAAAALRVAGAYRAAAAALTPVAGGSARPLPGALRRLARDHRRLAAASRTRRAAATRRAGARIGRQERRLAGRLARLT